MLTIPYHEFTPYLPPGVRWIRGQLELGSNDGYLHWQICLALCKKGSLPSVRRMFGPVHCELTKSDKASDYVWKEDTAIVGTRFELGTKPINPSDPVDWEDVWKRSREGKLEEIPAFVRVKSYRTIRAIASDYAKPEFITRSCRVFWGPTGTGKSHRAWDEAGSDAYSKSARTKFWDGYRDQKHVVMDEFRGAIDVGYLLTWIDQYPVSLEIKGSTVPSKWEKIWICSNLHPSDWFRDLDHETFQALERRLEIFEMTERYLA